MAEPIKRLWKNAVGSTNESQYEYGRLGKLDVDGSEQIVVPGIIHQVYVRVGVGETTGFIKALNMGAPRKYDIRVRMIKLAGIHIITGVDYTSGTLAADEFNTAYHHHGPDSGLGRANDGVHVYSAVAQSIPDDTPTDVIFPGLRIDQNSYFDAGLNTRLTAPETGWYAVSANLAFAANAVGYRRLHLRRSTGLVLAQDTRQAVTETGIATSLSAHVLSYFLAGQWVACEVRQTSGGALNVVVPEFQMVRTG